MDNNEAGSNQEFNINELVKSFRRIDLNLFVVFTTIYEYRSLTIASKHLSLTQPAVSHALSRLRDALNDKLFIRKGGESVPTPFAHAIVDDVRKALKLIQSGPLGQQQFDPLSSTANFRISMDAAVEMFLLPRLMTRLSEVAPNVTVSATRTQRRSTEAELSRGDLQLAIDIDFPFGLGIERRQLKRDYSVVAGSKHNPFMTNGLTTSSYLAANHIVCTSRRNGLSLDDYELARLGHRRNIAVRCTSLMVGLKIAENTNCLLSLGRLQYDTLAKDSDLLVANFPFAVPEIESMLYWHESVENEPGNVWMREQIFDIATKGV